MPNAELTTKTEPDFKTKSCVHTVGTKGCQNCVNDGGCPSEITSIEEINEVEKGKEYCYGQS